MEICINQLNVSYGQKQSVTSEILVVYHSPQDFGNFGCKVNGKINFVSPNGDFLAEIWDFFKGRPKYPNRISRDGKCAFHLLIFTSFRPFGLDCL